MKKIIIMFAVGLLIQQITHAQGTVYISNFEQTANSINSAVGSNAWWAAGFETGTNALGYSLDSIQLGMTNAVGNPSGFSVMIYSSIIVNGRGQLAYPSNSLATLSGSTDPSLAGIYSYDPASSLVLSSNTYYFIVVTAGTSTADGVYLWRFGHVNSYNPNGGWAVNNAFYSNNGLAYNGSNWLPDGYYPEYAITAEAVPEPSPSLLLLLGSGILFYARKNIHRKL